MAEITDQDRRVAHEWAASIDPEMSCWSDSARAVARVILATVDAPAPTLAERLREQFYDTEPTEEQYGIILDAEQMEHDLAEARAEVKALAEDLAGAESEVERLTAERDRLEAAQYLSDGSAWGRPVREPTVQKGAESNAESIDPADVKPGEAWLVECRGERRNAVKDNDDNNVPWNTINADGWLLTEDDEDVTLVSRLVPAPRVITNPDELERLAATSIIRDGRGWPGGVTDQGVIMINGFCVSDEEVISHGPATVLWDPEV